MTGDIAEKLKMLYIELGFVDDSIKKNKKAQNGIFKLLV